ncbi:MAG: uncharacterized protein QOI36_4253 [Pseudonocardiales bacterium]|nr:uncharacterized protein [Pseudonocardiales bacterium]
MTIIESTDLVGTWQEWHAERENVLRAPHGWLSLTGLHWLDAAPAAYPELPGTWRATGDGGVEVTAAASCGLEIDGAVVDGTVRIEPVDGLPGVLVTVGDRRIEVIRRTDSYALRVRDPQALTLTAFDSIPTYPVEPRWVLIGRFEPYDELRPITVDAVVEGLNHYFTAVGEVHLEIDGQRQRLVALPGKEGALSLHFRDATSGHGTYGGGRILATGDPAEDGTVIVDLNRTVNLPCAFTEFATCPLPPAGNTVTVPVEAGERSPARPDLA